MNTTSAPLRPTDRFGGFAQLLHWLTAILVLAAFSTGLGGPEQHVYSASRDFDRQLHETLGMAVFVLAIVRVIWMRLDSRPAQQAVSRLLHIGAKSVQGLLYLLLFAVPMTAIAGAWLGNHPIILLGGVELPALFGDAHDLGQSIAEIHTWLGDAILWLAGLHAVAAIYHHVILQDQVLETMLPRWLKVWRPGNRQ